MLEMLNMKSGSSKTSTSPQKPEWKKVKVPGATISYAPTKSNEAMVAKMTEGIKEKRVKRDTLEAELANNPLSDFTPNTCIVAFIDILGFGHEIEQATTKEDMERIYKKVRLVQKEFQKVSAADDPDEQNELNDTYGRRVIALSDAVVVVINPNCPAASMMGAYDFLGMSMFELLLAQALCVAKHGIFVRGGISHGSFFYENDVLLSPPLARAYQLESDHAVYPIIAVSDATRKAILEVPKKGHYAPGVDPTPRYFAKHGKRKWRGKGLYYLDYLPVMLGEEHRGWLPEDHKDYLEARKKGDDERAQAALNRRALKDAAYFLKWHKKRIEDAHTAAISEGVRKKYCWLMKYHNRSFRNDLEYLRDEVIDLAKFYPPKI